MNHPFDRNHPVDSALGAARRHLVYAAVFSGLLNLLYLAPTIFMLQVYDRVVPTRGTTTLYALVAILTVSLLVLSLLDLARMRLLLRASIRLEKRAAEPILHRILGATTASAGERSAAIRNLDTLRSVMTGPAILALFDAPWAPVYIIVCFLLHPALGAFALFASLLLAAIALASEHATKRGAAEAQMRAGIQTRIQDYAIQTAEVARALGMRQAVVQVQLRDRADLVGRQAQLAATSGGYLAVTKFLRQLFQSLALGLGAWLAVRFLTTVIARRTLPPASKKRISTVESLR